MPAVFQDVDTFNSRAKYYEINLNRWWVIGKRW